MRHDLTTGKRANVSVSKIINCTSLDDVVTSGRPSDFYSDLTHCTLVPTLRLRFKSRVPVPGSDITDYIQHKANHIDLT